MNRKKRVNISISDETHAKLVRLKTISKSKSVCQMLANMVDIILERSTMKRNAHNIEDDHEYIEELFSEYSTSEPEPCGDVPVRHNNRRGGT